ncbi:hypothetical protein [Acidisoma sp. 7E03]
MIAGLAMDNGSDLPALSRILDDTLAVLDGLGQRVEQLDAALLGGRPHAIAEATTLLEAELGACAPQLGLFRQAMAAPPISRVSLRQQFDQSENPGVERQIELIARRLRELARRSGAGLRRAERLGDGLTASLQALRAMDVIDRDHLLAEA